METTMSMTTNATKRCSKCGQELPLESFNKRRASKDGLQSRCKKCQIETIKEARKKKLQFSFTPKVEEKVEEIVKMTNPIIPHEKSTLAKAEESLIRETLVSNPCDSIAKCADKLGISERTLYRKINTYNLRELVTNRVGYRKKAFEEAIANNGLTKIKTLGDYTTREILEELHKRGYEGNFWRYVREEMSISKLFGKVE